MSNRLEISAKATTALGLAMEITRIQRGYNVREWVKVLGIYSKFYYEVISGSEWVTMAAALELAEDVEVSRVLLDGLMLAPERITLQRIPWPNTAMKRYARLM